MGSEMCIRDRYIVCPPFLTMHAELFIMGGWQGNYDMVETETLALATTPSTSGSGSSSTCSATAVANMATPVQANVAGKYKDLPVFCGGRG